MDALSSIWALVEPGVSLVMHNAVPFIIILTVLVFVHEMGHYLIARWNGVRVERFSIGFGPEMFGWDDKHGTRWKVSWLPLGGYVAFFGDASEASTPDREALDAMTADEREVAFQYKKLWQRAAIVAAGPLANFLFAIAALAVLFYMYGRPFTPPIIDSVAAGSAAEAAGMLAGDRIIEIDGSAIERFEDIEPLIVMRADEPVKVHILREREVLELLATPQLREEVDRFGNKQRMGRLGVARARNPEYTQHGVVMSTYYAVDRVGSMVSMTLQGLGQMIMGTRGADDLGGPIRIAQLSGQISELGFIALVQFAVLLSVNLGLLNLFPVPMLDGGHLLYYGFEAVRGKPLAEKIQEFGFRIGLAMILVLMVFATWNDLSRLFS